MSRIAVGRVLGPFGIQGWLRVQSYSRPPEGILQYRRWQVSGKAWSVKQGRPQGKAVVVQLKGVSDRAAALALHGAEIEVERTDMAPAQPGEYYWADLVGCTTTSVSGAELGQVTSLFSNGAQDVLVVMGERERMIPFVPAIVKQVDLGAKRILVDWEPEY